MPRRKRKPKEQQEVQAPRQQTSLAVETDMSAEIDILNRLMMQRFMPGYDALSKAAETLVDNHALDPTLSTLAKAEPSREIQTTTIQEEAGQENMVMIIPPEGEPPKCACGSLEESAVEEERIEETMVYLSEEQGRSTECSTNLQDIFTPQRGLLQEITHGAKAKDDARVRQYRERLVPIAANVKALEVQNYALERMHHSSWDKAWILLDVLCEVSQQVQRVEDLRMRSFSEIQIGVDESLAHLHSLLFDIAQDISHAYASLPLHYAQQLSAHVGYVLWEDIMRHSSALHGEEARDAEGDLFMAPVQAAVVEPVLPATEEQNPLVEDASILQDSSFLAEDSAEGGEHVLERADNIHGEGLDVFDDLPKADADIPAWSSRIQPRFEMTPGMTLRSTTLLPPSPIAARDANESYLIVTDEHRVDWRDLNYIPSPPVTPVRSGRTHLIVKAIAGGNELGGACYMLEMARYGKKILIDAGIRLRDLDNRFPDLAKLPDPDLIIITHAHLDHCGALPYIMRRWPSVPIWCHEETVPLIAQSLSLLVRQVGISPEHRVPELSLYDADEVARVQPIGKLCKVAYPLADTDLNIVFYPAGHCLGAVSFSVEGPEDSFFYSGEYAVHDEPSAPAAEWPDQNFDVVVALCSGFADRRFDRKAMQNRLIEEIARIVDAGAWAVFPVVETGRAQDIYLLLAEAMRSGALPMVPIYWDGEQRKLAQLYQQYVDKLDGDSLSFLDAPAIILDDELRAELSAGPGVLLTTPGVLQENVGVSLLTRLLDKPESAVFRPARPDTPFDLNPLLSSIHPEVQKHYYVWPAHPTVTEMADKVLSLSPLVVFMVHGDQEMQRGLRAQLPGHVIRRSLANGDSRRVLPWRRGF